MTSPAPRGWSLALSSQLGPWKPSIDVPLGYRGSSGLVPPSQAFAHLLGPFLTSFCAVLFPEVTEHPALHVHTEDHRGAVCTWNC